jgi:F-type H+-transporting ATPase subunit b
MDNPLVQPDPGLFIWTIADVPRAGGAARAGSPGGRCSRRSIAARRRSASRSTTRSRPEAGTGALQQESARIIAEARGEADAIISRTRSDAERVRDELKEKAQAEAASLVRNAERQIELETARAVQQIRREAVDLSMAIASKILQRRSPRRQRAADRRDLQGTGDDPGAGRGTPGVETRRESTGRAACPGASFEALRTRSTGSARARLLRCGGGGVPDLRCGAGLSSCCLQFATGSSIGGFSLE